MLKFWWADAFAVFYHSIFFIESSCQMVYKTVLLITPSQFEIWNKDSSHNKSYAQNISMDCFAIWWLYRQIHRCRLGMYGVKNAIGRDNEYYSLYRSIDQFGICNVFLGVTMFWIRNSSRNMSGEQSQNILCDTESEFIFDGILIQPFIFSKSAGNIRSKYFWWYP